MREFEMKSLSSEIREFFFKKLWFTYVLDAAKITWALQLLSQKSSWKIRMIEFWRLEST